MRSEFLHEQQRLLGLPAWKPWAAMTESETADASVTLN
jgi:hypothetical protein